MARTFTLTDQQCGDLLHIIRREAMASYTLQREKTVAEGLYAVITTTPHQPELEAE